MASLFVTTNNSRLAPALKGRRLSFLWHIVCYTGCNSLLSRKRPCPLSTATTEDVGRSRFFSSASRFIPPVSPLRPSHMCAIVYQTRGTHMSQQPYSPHQARSPMAQRSSQPPDAIDVFVCLHCRQWLAVVDSGALRFGNAIIRSRIELTCSCCGRKRIWRPVRPKPNPPKKAS